MPVTSNGPSYINRHGIKVIGERPKEGYEWTYQKKDQDPDSMIKSTGQFVLQPIPTPDPVKTPPKEIVPEIDISKPITAPIDDGPIYKIQPYISEDDPIEREVKIRQENRQDAGYSDPPDGSSVGDDSTYMNAVQKQNMDIDIVDKSKSGFFDNNLIDDRDFNQTIDGSYNTTIKGASNINDSSLGTLLDYQSSELDGIAPDEQGFENNDAQTYLEDFKNNLMDSIANNTLDLSQYQVNLL